MTLRDRLSLPEFENLEARMLMNADLTVTALNDGTVPSTIVPGESFTISATMTNQGDVAATSPTFAVRAYLSTDDQVDQGSDILVGEINGPINLPPTTASTFSMKVTVPVGAATGTYYLLLQVDADDDIIAESDVNNNVFVAKDSTGADRTRTLAWKFGSFAGRTNVKLTMPGSLDNGQNVTFAITGKTAYGEITSPFAAAAYDLSVKGATTASKLTLTGVAHDAVLSSVKIDACSLGTFSAANADLAGDFTADMALSSLSLFNAGSALTSDITITIGGASKSTFSASFVSLTNVHVLSASSVKSFTASNWSDTVTDRLSDPGQVDVLMAPSISALKTTALRGYEGDMQADISTAGAAKSITIAGDILDSYWSVGSLSTLKVIGTVSGSTIRSTGNVSTITVGAATNSNFLAGVNSAAVPTAASDFSATKATINKFTVAGFGPKNVARPRFFTNSSIAAHRVNTVSLLNVDLDNGGTNFGVVVLDNGQPPIKSLSSNDTESWFSWTWKPKGDRDFQLQDLIVHAVPLA